MKREPAVERVIFSAPEIRETIGQLARTIARDYAGQPLLVLGVLKGALYACVDLARALAVQPEPPGPIELDFITASSYGGSTVSSGNVRIACEPQTGIAGKNVLLVEDVVDGGLTLARLQAFVQERRPASLRTCVLFDKPSARMADVPVDYRGHAVPDQFVVGYGLDYQESYRNLPYLAQLRSWVFSQ